MDDIQEKINGFRVDFSEMKSSLEESNLKLNELISELEQSAMSVDAKINAPQDFLRV